MLTEWCKHKSVLCSTPPEAMCSEMPCEACTYNKLTQVFLHNIVRHFFLWIYHTIRANIGEETICWPQRLAKVSLQEPDVKEKMPVHINFRCVLLFINVINVACVQGHTEFN